MSLLLLPRCNRRRKVLCTWRNVNRSCSGLYILRRPQGTLRCHTEVLLLPVVNCFLFGPFAASYSFIIKFLYVLLFFESLSLLIPVPPCEPLRNRFFILGPVQCCPPNSSIHFHPLIFAKGSLSRSHLGWNTAMYLHEYRRLSWSF